MKKYMIMAIGVLLIALALQQQALRRVKSERDRYKDNTEALLNDVTKYKVQDSLNASRVGALELSLKEYKKHYAEDQELIKELKSKGSDVSQVVKTETKTEIKVITDVKDSIVYLDTLKCFEYNDKWLTIKGCISHNQFDGNVSVRDSLLVVESVKRKRFLGFLWKIKKIKYREWQIVSRNPHTEIEDISVVRIKD